MASINNAIALQLLRHDRFPSISGGERHTVSGDMLAIANRLDKPSEPQHSKTAPDIYSVHHVDANQLKLRLFERVGKEFGINMNDYDSLSGYGEAIRDAVLLLRREPGGYLQLPEIERKLGLDKLGISIDTLISAIIDPGSKHADRLDEAMKREAGEDLEDGKKADPQVVLEAIQLDETGIYGY